MPRTTLVAGTTITAAWANTNVRDQVVTPFASAAARDSAIVSPIEGQYAHLNDTNYLTHYNGTVWVPTTNNIVGRHILTGDSSVFSATGVTDWSISNVVVFSTRIYRVTLKSDYLLTFTSGAAIWDINFHVDGSLTDKFHVIDRGVNDRTALCSSILWQPTSGTKTCTVSLVEVSGVSTVTFQASGTNQRSFWVEDIGPR